MPTGPPPLHRPNDTNDHQLIDNRSTTLSRLPPRCGSRRVFQHSRAPAIFLSQRNKWDNVHVLRSVDTCARERSNLAVPDTHHVTIRSRTRRRFLPTQRMAGVFTAAPRDEVGANALPFGAAEAIPREAIHADSRTRAQLARHHASSSPPMRNPVSLSEPTNAGAGTDRGWSLGSSSGYPVQSGHRPDICDASPRGRGAGVAPAGFQPW